MFPLPQIFGRNRQVGGKGTQDTDLTGIYMLYALEISAHCTPCPTRRNTFQRQKSKYQQVEYYFFLPFLTLTRFIKYILQATISRRTCRKYILPPSIFAPVYYDNIISYDLITNLCHILLLSLKMKFQNAESYISPTTSLPI